VRIVLVNWAKIWHGASRGGGVNGYVQSLALGLLDRGHEVISLCSGTRKMPPKGARPRGRRAQPDTDCHARRLPDWLGVGVYEIVNSPVAAPSIRQIDRPEPEIESPVLDRVVGELLGHLRPDIVHIHSLEGFTARLVDAARRAGATVLFSLHNYHTICPQVYLMQAGQTPCRDFDNGHACARCAVALKQDSAAPQDASGAGGVGGGVGARGTRVRTGDDTDGPRTLASEDRRGMTLRVLDERAQGGDAGSSAFIPIDNEVGPEPGSERSPNGYALRRAAMVGALNRCDRVLAVSDFVARLFGSKGVERRVLEVVPIGTRMTELARQSASAVAPPSPFAEQPGRPIRLVFIGYHNRYKGLGLLIEALESLDTRRLARFHLSVHAQGGERVEPRLRRLEPRLARLSFGTGYEYQDIPYLVGGADLGVVPSTWWDNGPQTVFELLACGVPVLGARVGGIPDVVWPGVNGMLFRAGDRVDLARALGEIAADARRLDGLRAGVERPKSMEAHMEELVALYQRTMAGSAEGASAEGSGARSDTRAG